MNDPKKNNEAAGGEAVDLDSLVASADTGGRSPGPKAAAVIFYTALVWSLFQLWFASPLPFAFRFGVFNDTEARSIHLAFAIFLAYLAYPALRRSPRNYVPAQ
ncbi:MAG: C4-dicarboxylate ABC transporter, partial [Kiloniellales bacterium]|nr:C4-dicarboxylate ABC transporter [Kiloniellales bacterium]